MGGSASKHESHADVVGAIQGLDRHTIKELIEELGQALFFTKRSLQQQGLDHNQIFEHEEVKIMTDGLLELIKARGPLSVEERRNIDRKPTHEHDLHPPHRPLEELTEEELHQAIDSMTLHAQQLQAELSKRLNPEEAMETKVYQGVVEAHKAILRRRGGISAKNPNLPLAEATQDEDRHWINHNIHIVTEKLQVTKSELRSQGLTSKEINAHPEVQELIAELSKLIEVRGPLTAEERLKIEPKPMPVKQPLPDSWENDDPMLLNAGDAPAAAEPRGAVTTKAEAGGKTGVSSLPPWWILAGVKPQGPEKDMGDWKAVSFSPSQQERYFVDEDGKVTDAENHKAAIAALQMKIKTDDFV